MMTDFEAKNGASDPAGKWLAVDVEREILRAVANIKYGSVEVVIHDGKVVQIECREKIRVARDEAGRKKAIRQIR
jgi:hypothetical protein